MLYNDDDGLFESVLAETKQRRTSKMPVWLGLLLLALAFAVDVIGNLHV